jgi:hypothetical protein
MARLRSRTCDWIANRSATRLPARFCGAELVQGVDQRVAAGQRHRDQVGLELHLARQRALGEHHPAEQGVDQRADRPHHDPQHPADPGDADVLAGQAVQERVERVAARDDVPGDLLRHVHPAADRHRPLREVAELVGEHGADLAEGQRVDQAEPDLEVLAGREHQVGDRQVVEHRGVDPRRQVDPVRARRAGLVRDLVQEREQAGMVGGRELERAAIAAAADEHQRLEHEDGQESGRDAASQEPEPRAPVVTEMREQAVRRPGEPGGEAEVQREEGEQAGDREVRVALVCRARPREIGRHAGGERTRLDHGGRQYRDALAAVPTGRMRPPWQRAAGGAAGAHVEAPRLGCPGCGSWSRARTPAAAPTPRSGVRTWRR